MNRAIHSVCYRLISTHQGSEAARKGIGKLLDTFVRRKNHLFMGSEGRDNASVIAYKLIETAKLNGINPQAWLTDILSRITHHKITRNRRAASLGL